MQTCYRLWALIERGDELIERREALEQIYKYSDNFLDPDTARVRNKNINSFEVAPSIFVFPCLSRDFCEILIDAAEAYDQWEGEQGDEFSAPEARLRRVMPRLEDHIATIVTSYLNGIVKRVFLGGYRIGWISSPFIIRYSLTTQKSMDLHYDGMSEVTISIPLSSDFEGGGLNFPRQRYTTTKVKPGNAIIFPGGPSHLHQALPVEKGVRYSLTIWTRNEPPEGDV